MNKINRYLLKIVIPSFAIGLLFYLSLFLLRSFFEVAELSLRQGIPFIRAVHIVSLSLPSILVMIMPMGIIFGFLYAISSLQKNNEMLAMLSIGMNRRQIMKPFILFSIFLMLVSCTIMLLVLPTTNHALVNYRLELLRSAISQNIEPRQFIKGFGNKVVYAMSMDESKTKWENVYIFDSDWPEQRIITARKGTIFNNSFQTEVWLKLTDVITHVTHARRPDSPRYQINTSVEQNLLLKKFDQQDGFTHSKGLREMSLGELIESYFNETDPSLQREILIEANKKFTLPVACLVFGWIAVAYALRKPHMKGTSAFTLSLLFIIIYYIIMSVTEDMAIDGKMHTILASWLPGGVIFLLGIIFYRMRGLKKRTFFPSLRIRFSKKRKERSGIPGMRRFPTLVDTYLWSIFLMVFAFVITALVILYLLIDFTQIFDELRSHEVSLGIILPYYFYLIPGILYELAIPLSLLVALALTVGHFDKRREFLAFRSLGISLFRLSVPFIMVTALIAGLALGFGETLMPLSNKKAIHYRNIIYGKDPGKIGGIPGEWHLLIGSQNYMIGYAWADIPGKKLHDTMLIAWGDTGHINRRYYAEKLLWHENHWVMVNGWIRDFDGDTVRSFKTFTIQDLPYPESLNNLLYRSRKPHEMSFFALYQYIQKSARAGHTNAELNVKLWQKISIPLSMIILPFIGFSLIFRFPAKKATTLWQVGLSLGIAFSYWALVALFLKFGELNALPPLLAAFTPIVIMTVIGVYAYLDMKT